MKKRIVSIVIALAAAITLIPAASAHAYLHAEAAANTCWGHVYPSAEANLRPYGGIQSWGYYPVRTNDTSVQLQIEAFSNYGTFVGGDGHTYWLTDRLACRVVGNDPGTVTAIADWGTTWRNAYQLWN